MGMNRQGERFAIISDIHGNLEALEAVFKEIDNLSISRVICLGDIVGYGADFERCIDIIVERCNLVLCGNHDEAVILGSVDFNPIARDVIEYTKRVLKPTLFSPSIKRIRWNYLKKLTKEGFTENNLSFYHGSPRDPVKEYVMRTDVVFAPEKLKDIFRLIQKICFIGHTHQPGVIVDEETYYFYEPEKLQNCYVINDKKAIINVGSVGQPRDSDNRASFVIYEDGNVNFKRVEYDYRSAMKKIEENPDIHDNCAARLALGK